MINLQFSDKVLNIPFAEKPHFIILKPGKYLFEAYGASGGSFNGTETTARNTTSDGCINEEKVDLYGGNTECRMYTSQPGAGGYASGIFIARFSTPIYVVTGGQGKYGAGDNEGGYNGGGSSCAEDSESGSGGGATDFRLFTNSLYSRILVAGGGGGSDDSGSFNTTNYHGSDDGSGGSGGLIGQGMWKGGQYQSEYETNTTYGFSFGQGEKSKACKENEQAGAGGGFFGGFTFQYSNSGAGGGSSFAFSQEIEFPTDLIETKNENGNVIEKSYYAFKDHPEYYLTSVEFATGIWSGNGKARITILHLFSQNKCTLTCLPHVSFSYIFIGFLLENN